MGNEFGAMLKRQRISKCCNYLELNLKTSIVINHLKSLENGQVYPNEEIVAKLQNALEMSSKDSQIFWQLSNLDDQDVECPVNTEFNYSWANIGFLLENTMPYPALMLDESMTIIKANLATIKLFAWLLGLNDKQTEGLVNEPTNFMDLVLLHQKFKKNMTNWPQVAVSLIERDNSQSPALQVRIDRIFETLPPEELQRMQGSSAQKCDQLITEFNFKKDGVDISLEETQTNFIFNSTEFRNRKMTISSFLPKDQQTKEFFNRFV